jgi:hypothetical protein
MLEMNKRIEEFLDFPNGNLPQLFEDSHNEVSKISKGGHQANNSHGTDEGTGFALPPWLLEHHPQTNEVEPPTLFGEDNPPVGTSNSSTGWLRNMLVSPWSIFSNQGGSSTATPATSKDGELGAMYRRNNLGFTTPVPDALIDTTASVDHQTNGGHINPFSYRFHCHENDNNHFNDHRSERTDVPACQGTSCPFGWKKKHNYSISHYNDSMKVNPSQPSEKSPTVYHARWVESDSVGAENKDKATSIWMEKLMGTCQTMSQVGGTNDAERMKEFVKSYDQIKRFNPTKMKLNSQEDHVAMLQSYQFCLAIENLGKNMKHLPQKSK